MSALLREVISRAHCATKLYDETSHSASEAAKVIGCLPTWRNDLNYGNSVMHHPRVHHLSAVRRE